MSISGAAAQGVRNINTLRAARRRRVRVMSADKRPTAAGPGVDPRPVGASEWGADPPSPPPSPSAHGSPSSPSDGGLDDISLLKRQQEKFKGKLKIGNPLKPLPVDIVERKISMRKRKAEIAEEAERTGRTSAAIATERQRVTRRREMEEAGRLALGRRKLGLPVAASAFTDGRLPMVDPGPEDNGGVGPKVLMGGLIPVRAINGSNGYHHATVLKYEPTDADRLWVAAARASGASIELISRMIRLPRERMELYFPVELSVDSEMGVVAAETRLMQRGIVDGDVGALRAYLAAHGGSKWQSARAAGASLTFGKDPAGRDVVTFVIEGFKPEGVEIEGETVDESGEAVKPRSER